MSQNILKVRFPKKLEPYIKNPKRFNVLEGGRGGAKSHTVAESYLIEGMTDRLRFLCTREIQKSIKESVHQLLSDKIHEKKYPYTIKRDSIIANNTGSEFFFHGLQDKTALNLKSFEGADRCWVEEAQGITKKSLDILIPTIRKPGSRFVFTMNRLEENDPVYAQFCRSNRDDVLHIHINYFDNPYCPQVLIDEAMQCKEDNLTDYLHIWEGQPLAQGDAKILRIDKIKQAMERTVEGEGMIDYGVDVARFGDDRTVIFKRHGLKVLDYQVYKGLRTYEVADRVCDMIEDGEEYIIKVDDTGVGGGVTDELYRREKNVVPVNNGEKAKDLDKYPNAISEMWFEFASMIDEVEIPNDNDLLQELSGREYRFDKVGKRVIEPKADFKKRYGKSPDLADSLLLCFYNCYHESGFV